MEKVEDTLELETPPDHDNLIDPVKNKAFKFEWYWSIVFLVTWIILFCVAVLPSYYAFPKHLRISDEKSHPGEFIGERAEQILLRLSSIEDKSVGGRGHHKATQYLLDIVSGIVNTSRQDLYDLEVDLQQSTGKTNFKTTYFIEYKNMTNIVIRIRPRNVKNTNALLLNTHYDSEIDSPGAGDAGIMVSVLIEVFRVLASSEEPLDHTVIFLLNGAEEIGLVGSHAFITNHKWAKDVKAVINLDSAGSGGREIVFQSGPNHPWLMKYYKQSVPYPFVSTVAEELFEYNFIPSETDFRIFKEFGGIPGLDLAHTYNGFVYHTKFDKFSILPKGTYQITGSNILALTRSLANAKELDDLENNEAGHAVFFDMAGWFMVYYTETEGVIINITVCISALALIGLFVYLVEKEYKLTYKVIFTRYAWLLGIHILTIGLIFGINFLEGFVIDVAGYAMPWYSNSWLISGVYFCSSFYLLAEGHSIFLGLKWTKKQGFHHHLSIQMVLHSHCFLLVILTIVMTAFGIRSSFMLMISVFFFAATMLINLLTKFYKHPYLWAVTNCFCHLLPFWFYTYMVYAFLTTFIPIHGRNGSAKNPELFIAVFAAIFGILYSGFIIPLLHLFRKPKIIVTAISLVVVVFELIMLTPVSFPYRPETSVQRYEMRHTNRLFYELDGSLTRNDSGFAIFPQDRSITSLREFVNLKESLDVEAECKWDAICGMPVYGTDSTLNTYFIPGPHPVIYANPLFVNLKEKSTTGKNIVRFEFEFEGADRIFGAVKVHSGSRLTMWSMDPPVECISNRSSYKFSFFYGGDKEKFNISLEFDRSDALEDSTFTLSLVSHHVHETDWFTDDFLTFLNRFPNWVYPRAWVSQYYRRFF